MTDPSFEVIRGATYCKGGCGFTTRQANGYVRGHTPRDDYEGCVVTRTAPTHTPRTYSASSAVSELVGLYVDNLGTSRQMLTAGIAVSITHLVMRESGMTESQADEWASDLVTDEMNRRA